MVAMSKVFQTVALVVALVFLPFMVALLFNAGAEAFFGDKEPMLQTLAGLLCGAFLAAFVGVFVLTARNGGMAKLANGLVIVIVLIDVLAIPIARWLIRLAYASPSNVIELW